MDNFSKQPYEEFTISADFSKNLLVGETITSQTVTVTDVTGVDVSNTVTNQSSVSNDATGKVMVLVRAGSKSASPYKITFRCVTSLFHKWEYDVVMKVYEL